MLSRRILSSVAPVIRATYITTSANWQSVVNEPQQDGLTSYVFDSNPGDADFYGIGSIASTPATVIATTVRAYAQKSDAGTRTLAVQLKSGATTVASPTLVLTTSGFALGVAHGLDRSEYRRSVDPGSGQQRPGRASGDRLMANTTWNPSDKSASLTLSNGNLTLSASALGGVRAIDRQITGKFYWEVTATTWGASCVIGVAAQGASLAGAAPAFWCYLVFGGTYLSRGRPRRTNPWR